MCRRGMFGRCDVKRVLFVATIKRHIDLFHIPYLKWFKEQGWETSVCARNECKNSDEGVIPHCDHFHDMPFERNPFKVNNIKVYRDLKRLIETNNYDIIHCHTPVGGLIARLAARDFRKHGTKVIYTAHGFHFYKGAPLLNWILYYPIEKCFAHFTDCMIVINEEDYLLAKTKKFKAGLLIKTNGVGVDLSRFFPVSNEDKSALRTRHGYSDDEFILLYIAEFNKDKNHSFLLYALQKLMNEIPNVRLKLAGTGKLLPKIHALACKLGVANYVEFLGYRTDIPDLCKVADVLVSPSTREGLPINVTEGMATGLPVACMDNRGHRELIRNGENGFLIPASDLPAFIHAIKSLFNNPELCNKFGVAAAKDVQRFSLEKVIIQMVNLYSSW